MDIFIRNVPTPVTRRALKKSLGPHLNGHGIEVFECQKLGKTPYALLTILDIPKAREFLAAILRRHLELWAKAKVRPKQASRRSHTPQDTADGSRRPSTH